MKTNHYRKTSQNLVIILVTLVISIVALSDVIVFQTNTGSRYGLMYRSYVNGDIAEEDVRVISSVDIIDEQATEQARVNASKSVLPVFSYNSKTTISALKNFDFYRITLENKDYYNAGKYTPIDIIDKINSRNSYELLGISYDLTKEILTNGYYNYEDIITIKSHGYDSLTVINNYLDDVPFDGEKVFEISEIITSANLNSYITDSAIELGLDADEIYILKYLVGTFVKPNVELDDYVTGLRRTEAYNNVNTVVLSLNEGDPIILKDHVIRQENLDLLRTLSVNAPLSFKTCLSNFVFYFLTIFVTLQMIRYFNRDNKKFIKELLILTDFVFFSGILFVGYIHLVNYLGLEFEYSMVPVAFVPVLAVLISGKKKIGYEYSILSAVIYSRIPGVNVITFFYFMFIALVCCLFIRLFNKRIDMILSWLLSIVFCGIVTILLTLISQNSYSKLINLLIGSLFNITVTYFAMAIIVPILERLFNLPTVYRLHELAFFDNEMLTRLQNVAPGTYTHSCAVADLSEAGARKIGANPLLCRVGALYHDIGKMEHPEYFVENQSGNNKHDDLNPSLSASIIKNHIKVGSQKGKDIGLPEEVVEIIECHHGNDVISYFYNEAVKENKTDQDIYESDYTYDADIPNSKECGIVMLADSIEAASRTVTPNPQKYNKLIESIFLKKIANSQLDNCGLTMGDLKILRNTFVTVLLAKNHSRIEYPDQEEK